MKLKENSKAIIVSAILLCLSAVGILFNVIQTATIGLPHFVCSVFNIVSVALIAYTAYGIIKNEDIEKVLQRFILSLVSFPAVGIFIQIISVFVFGERIRILELILDIVILIPSILIMYAPAIIVINEMIKNNKPNKFLSGFSIFIIVFNVISMLARIRTGSMTFVNAIQSLSGVALFYGGLLAYNMGIEEDESIERPEKPEKVIIEENNIAKMVILSIITLGIYTYVWIYKIAKKIKELDGDFSSVATEIICIMFVPFYLLYWVYTRYAKLKAVSDTNGIEIGNNGVLYLILSLLGLGLIAIALIQNDLNIMARSMKGEAPKVNISKNNDNVETLKKLSELHTQGILSDEEYEMKKKEILERI